MHRRFLALTLVVPALLAGACSADHNDNDNQIADWVASATQKLNADEPTSDDVDLDAGATCPLTDELRVDGHALDPAGTGSAVYGGSQRSGLRFQCAFGGDDGPASAQIEVVLLDDDAAYGAYADLINSRPDQETTNIDGHDVLTAEGDEPGTYDAQLLLPINSAAIHLVLQSNDGDTTAAETSTALIDALKS